MSEYLIQGETLTAIADAVRSKTGETELIPVGEIAEKISNIVSGSTVKVAFGTVAADTTNLKVTHNLGVVPDLVVLLPGQSQTTVAASVACFACGASAEFATKAGVVNAILLTNNNTSSPEASLSNFNTLAITSTSQYAPVNNATATSVSFYNNGTIKYRKNMVWLAFAGLT